MRTLEAHTTRARCGGEMRQIIVGAVVCVLNIAIHALVMSAVVKVAEAAERRAASLPLFGLAAIMSATVLVLMAAHTLEVLVWAVAYAMFGVARADADLIYFAFVNYTTLGYGDVTPVRDWELLGPITAMNGVLLFGWSTAVIFEVLRNAMNRDQ
jgi:hypothetical protein